MAENIYDVETLALPGQPTVVVTDDGSGSDWIVMLAAHLQANVITLQYTYTSAGPTSASATYSDAPGESGNRLVVQGEIENARGSDGVDHIAGNTLANIIYGDSTAGGPGGADSLFGGAGNDRIYGGAGADLINGAGDNDHLFGDAGADTISGALGRDTVEGGAGADVLSGGAEEGDTISYRRSSAGVVVRLTFGDTTTGEGGDAQGDRVTGFRDILGSDFNDRLVDTVEGTISFGYNDNLFEGFGGADVLRLGGGNDSGYGGAGSDSLYGEVGRDRLWGEEGSDTILGGAGGDSIWGGDGYDYMSGDAGVDVIRGGDLRDRIYGGDGEDQLWGDGGDDLIFANDGQDSVTGGDGDDTLLGLEGSDLLWGGTGADEFMYLKPTEGGDRILDMSAADRVELQFPFGTPAISWDNAGALGPNRARLVDTGANVELRINLDADTTVEFRLTFVGAGSVSQSQIEL